MTDIVWEPLAELQLNFKEPQTLECYCLCSRSFIRSKKKFENWTAFIKEDAENIEEVENPKIKISDTIKEPQTSKKSEVDAISCYCSACNISHDITGNYENLTHQYCVKEQNLICSLQNSDSGTDLTENFNERSNKVFDVDQSKSKVDIAWEKYWSKNGESIIWKSWIEKYGAYINPNYLEQNLAIENYNVESNEKIKEENSNLCAVTYILNKSDQDIYCKSSAEVTAVSPLFKNIPYLKINNYSSCGSLLETREISKSDTYNKELDKEEKILKSNSFGSYATYEKVKGTKIEYDKLKINDYEKIKNKSSYSNLSVKSIANTTVTTDSMTNVTKISLSSLDLSYGCESSNSGSFTSGSEDESNGHSSNSTTSSKEEIITEADLWWKMLWKEHYEDQYITSYEIFKKDFEVLGSSTEVEKSNTFKKNLECFSCVLKNPVHFNLNKFNKTPLNLNLNDSCNHSKDDFDKENECSDDACELAMDSCEISQAKINLKKQFGISIDGFKGLEEAGYKCQKNTLCKKLNETERHDKHIQKLDKVKQALGLMGYSFKLKSEELQSGYVNYRKKNIRGQNRHLKLYDTKPRIHIFFDDDGNSCEEKQKDYSLLLENSESVCEKNQTDLPKLNCGVFDLESLGYEAYSSSVEENKEAVKENKKQKKKRKKQKKYILPQEIVENKKLIKYWLKRYQLFSKFDKGVKLDTESWFSVTPENLAAHHAERCRCDVIVDAFCGVGGNSIQFAFTCERVIAIDIDPIKIEMAKHNAKIYGVEDRIEFIVGDFVSLAKNLRADVVFLSPPWGGPEYISFEVYDLNNILPPLGGEKLFTIASEVAENVAYFLPKNANSIELALLCGRGKEVEIEQNFLDRKLRSVTAYFGELIMDPDDPFLESNRQ